MNNAKSSPAESFFKESFILTLVKDYGWITFAVAATIVAANFFFTPIGLVPGGITSLPPVCSTVFGIPISTMSFCVSIPLLTLSTIVLGKSFGIKMLHITLVAPLFIRLVPSIHTTQFLPGIYPLLELAITGLLGGPLVGAAIDTALNRVCAARGTDVITPLIQYVSRFLKVSVVLFFLDGSAMIASGVITQDASTFVFSFLSLMVIIRTIDFVTKYELST